MCALGGAGGQWLTGLDGTHIEGAGKLCLDVQDASTKDGANVMSYTCGDRPGGNQRWSITKPEAVLLPAGGAMEGVQVVTKLDGKRTHAANGPDSPISPRRVRAQIV